MKSNTLFALLMTFALPLVVSSAEVIGKVSSADGGRGMAGAIVYVVSGVQPSAALPKRQPPKLLIRGGRLVPVVLVVLGGETFTLTSADADGYNVQFQFRERTELNLALSVGRPTTTVKAGRPELFTRVSEDLGRLHGYVCVLEHPFYALTGVSGMFKLPDLPPGTYTIEAAHPREGRVKHEVAVGGASATVDFTLPGRTKAKTP
jgi:hypothetical protein